MEKVKQFYMNFNWDIEISNNEEDETKTLFTLMKRLIHIICKRGARFDTAIKTLSPNLHALAAEQEMANLKESLVEKFAAVNIFPATNASSKRIMLNEDCTANTSIN